jgi:hypothetical protein
MGFLSAHLYTCLAVNKKSNFHLMILIAREQLYYEHSHHECLICGGGAKDIPHDSN